MWQSLTLKARTIGILCTVFIFSQVVSLLIFEHNRDAVILSTEATDLADRVIGIVELAYHLPEKDRQQILSAAETQFLTLFPEVISTDEVACQNNSFSDQISVKLHVAFARLPGVDAHTCVRNFDEHLFSERRTTLREGFDVLIQIDFDDEHKTTFHSVLPVGQSLFQDTVIFYLLLECILALLVAWYLIRKNILPIETLAQSAEQTGLDINKPPLDEGGPKEVAMAAKAFNTMQRRLADLLKNQREVLEAISHDLRSAVTRLQLRADLLENDHERQGMLRVVGDMRQMIQSTLDFLRGQESDEVTRIVNINALVESLCTDLSDEGLPVGFRGQANQITLPCRPTDVRRSLQNIINNAIKYAGGAFVSVVCTEKHVRIEVKDQGEGIPDEQLEQVLQPFYRLEQSRNDDTGGIGLGLSIADNIARSHGGSLQLQNNPEGGLSVELILPLGHKAANNKF